MKSTIAWIATIFVMASGAAPAMAADWGGVKDMGGGVPIPVPAPAPVPTYDADSDWYIGLSIGGDLSNSASIKDTDIDYLGDKSPGYFARSDVPAQVTFGLTFGRYFTPSLRWEVAVDYTPDTQISRDQRLGYEVHPSSYDFNNNGFVTNDYGVSRTDTIKLSRTTALFNLLYDIPTGTRFTPYLGGGLGFTWRRLSRSYSENYACLDTPCSSAAAPSSASPISGSDSKNQIDLAAAVQAGIATDLTDSIVWDNGWQMLWEGGSISSSAPSAAGTNRFTFDNSVIQQFRSGIRIKFD